MTDLIKRLRAWKYKGIPELVDLTDEAADALEAAEKRIEELELRIDMYAEHVCNKQAERIERLRAALEHYANKDNWREVETTDPYLVVANDFDWPGDLGDEPYDIAREALES